MIFILIDHHHPFWDGALGLFSFRLKAVAYPVTGAFLGGVIGGPIGLVAGLKIGGIAAIGCAIAGYTGGKFLNKLNKADNIQTEAECSKTDIKSPDSSQKKDIWRTCHIC